MEQKNRVLSETSESITNESLKGEEIMINPIELWLTDRITYWEMIEQFQKEEEKEED